MSVMEVMYYLPLTILACQGELLTQFTINPTCKFVNLGESGVMACNVNIFKEVLLL